MSFDGAGEGSGGARTAASKRMQSEREAREAAQAAVQLTKDQQQQQSQAQHQSRPIQQQQQAPLAPYQRPSIPMASALGGGGGGAGDIQVGSNGLPPQQSQQQQQQHHLSHPQSQSSRYAAFNPSSYQPQQSPYAPQAQGFTSNPNPNMYANSGAYQQGAGAYSVNNLYAQMGAGQGYPGVGGGGGGGANGGYNPNGLGRSQGGQGQ